jgi:hypothetical protein
MASTKPANKEAKVTITISMDGLSQTKKSTSDADAFLMT